MVKVKGVKKYVLDRRQLVSTTLWWKLKVVIESPTIEVYCFNHPMVKVKERGNSMTFNELFSFQPPYGES